MSTRQFVVTGRTVSSGSSDDLFDAVDAAITAALEQEDIDASVGAEAAVDAIQTAVDAAKASAVGGGDVTLVINGSLNQNQIRAAVERALAVIAQSPAEFPTG
jgi:hypothetical protein